MVIDKCIWDYCPAYSYGWPKGPPRGILFHTDNCGDPEQFGAILRHRGSSVHFCIGRNPQETPTHQYVDLENSSWHLLEASHYYYGITHVAYPGVFDLTLPQLTESARISAEIIKFIKQKWGVTIPLIRAPGFDFTPGFKEHRDGLGSNWNPEQSSDGLYILLTWPEYLAIVANFLEDDEFMALFADLEDFRKNVLLALGGETLSQDEVLSSLEFLNGMNTRSSEKERPDGTKGRGWDFADHILKLENGDKIIPESGTITGKVTFNKV